MHSDAGMLVPFFRVMWGLHMDSAQTGRRKKIKEQKQGNKRAAKKS